MPMRSLLPVLLLLLTLAALAGRASAAGSGTTAEQRREERIQKRVAERRNAAAQSARRRAERRRQRATVRSTPARVRLEEVLALVNGERTDRGLSSLVRLPVLDSAAQTYAERMEREAFLAHTAPDGTTFAQRFGKIDLSALTPPCRCSRSTKGGENLAQGQRTPAEVVEDWMESPGHRANILDPLYRWIGLGWHNHYWAQLFFGVEENPLP